MLVFPGSYSLWLRMIEANFSSELSSQAVNKLSKLIVFLESLSITSSTLIFPETTLKLIQKLLTTLYENYDKMQTEGIITRDQLQLLNLLSHLKEKLMNTFIITSLDIPVSI